MLGSCSSATPKSLLKRFNTRPVGFAWKKSSGARSTRAVITPCMRLAASRQQWKQSTARLSPTRSTAAVSHVYVCTHVGFVWESDCAHVATHTSCTRTHRHRDTPPARAIQ